MRSVIVRDLIVICSDADWNTLVSSVFRIKFYKGFVLYSFIRFLTEF